MISEILITNKHLEKLEEIYPTPIVSKRTIVEGTDRYGKLAEVLFLEQFGGEFIDNRHFDILLEPFGKIDVKAKIATVVPQPTYLCTVNAYQHNNQCDYYVFYRGMKDYSKFWLLGGISKKEFMEKARFMKAGDMDFNHRVKCDQYGLAIQELYDIGQILKEASV